jgi:hypothetical protein
MILTSNMILIQMLIQNFTDEDYDDDHEENDMICRCGNDLTVELWIRQ